MKFSDMAKGDWYVALKKSGKKVFFGDKNACIRFITGFDRASSKYVDLRLFTKDGREFDYHKNKFAEQE